MPKYIYLYGPDGSGKTAIALEIKKLFPNTTLVPFEPYRLDNRDFDSGYNGKDSASNSPTNSLLKSYLLFFRYIFNDIFFKIKNISSNKDYIIYTRGILEFGINNANKNFPSSLSRFYQCIFQRNSILIITPAESIIKRKDELKLSDIIDLYMSYLNCNIKKVENILSLNDCVCQIIKKY